MITYCAVKHCEGNCVSLLIQFSVGVVGKRGRKEREKKKENDV